MTPILKWLILTALINVTVPTAAPESGIASRYDPGVMGHTIAARLDMGHLTPQQVAAVDVYVAVLDCADIGRNVWIWFNGADDWLPALVTDCAVRDDSDGARSWMVDNGVLFEVDGTTAARYGYTCVCSKPALMSWVDPWVMP